MRKNHLLVVLVFGFIFGTASCTSKKVDQESTDSAEMTGEADTAASGDEATATEGSSDEVSELADDFGSDEEAAKPGDAAATDEAATDDTAKTDEASDELDALDDSTPAATDDAATQELATSDTPAEAPLDPAAETAPLDSAAATDAAALSSDESQGLTEEPVAPKPMIPLQKMVTAPYTSGKTMVNAIYVARQGDTTSSVSQKIFGQDKSGELKKINPTLARRSMKVGDKVYYNSPQRPTDSTQMLTYYEDMGLSPEVYLSQPGDNIRVVSKKLLGDDNSWKEIWSTNLEVESKGELAEGTRLRYWSAETSAAPAMAATTPVETAPPATEPPPAQMPEEVVAQNTPPPAEMAPPPMEAQQEVAPPPVAAEPPPPMERPAATADGSATAALGDDPDQMMALGAGAILLLAAVALFIIIRKKRAKRGGIDFQTATHTQIE